ncbi:cobalamin B12-binding domain-containing protein [Nocardioides aquiterrae]|uniref:B12-binding domain-containing protein n=1 Tax=Nocardioides aquiterrae TaxID=203799 RepID=A0ABN1U8D9_9ACTN
MAAHVLAGARDTGPAGRGASAVHRLTTLLELPGGDPDVEDVARVVVAALESARQTGQAELLADALGFAEGRFQVLGHAGVTRQDVCVALQGVAAESLDGDDPDGLDVLRDLVAGCASQPFAPPEEPVLGPPAAAYLDRVVRGDRAGAVAVVHRCVSDGMDVVDILVEILAPVQVEVGRRWYLGQLSVAHEHFCTAVSQLVMTELYTEIFLGQDGARRVVAVHAPGSLHRLGLRMVVDVLQCRGWGTTYVIDDVLPEALPRLLTEDRADVLLLSATMPSEVDHLRRMIRAVRHDPRTRGVKVVVGGRAFELAPGLVDHVGADGCASDARTAVQTCRALVGDHDGR